MGNKPAVWSSTTTNGHPSNEVNGLGHCRDWVGAALAAAKQCNLRFAGTPKATVLGDQLCLAYS